MILVVWDGFVEERIGNEGRMREKEKFLKVSCRKMEDCLWNMAKKSVLFVDPYNSSDSMICSEVIIVQNARIALKINIKEKMKIYLTKKNQKIMIILKLFISTELLIVLLWIFVHRLTEPSITDQQKQNVKSIIYWLLWDSPPRAHSFDVRDLKIVQKTCSEVPSR